MVRIDLDNLNEESVYSAFNVDGNESDALNDSYLELYELIGRDALLATNNSFTKRWRKDT